MSVTVTWNETTDSFTPTRKTTTHKEAHSFAVGGEDGVLHLFDYSPETLAESAKLSTLAHTVAVYAKGEWVKAVRR